MYTSTYSPVDVSLILKRMGLHPLQALNATYSGCGGPSLKCEKTLGAGFVDRLAEGVRRAADIIESYLGYSPYPKFLSEDVKYPTEAGCHVPMQQPRTGKFKSVALRKNYLLKVGRRKTDLLGTAIVQYLDLDGDGLRETARITHDFGAGNEPDEACLVEYHAFFSGGEGQEKFRVRPKKNAILTGSVLTIEYEAWQLIKPLKAQSVVAQLANGTAIESINLCCTYNANNEVEASNEEACAFPREVEIRRLYVDSCQCPAVLRYEGGLDKCGCGKPNCIATTAPACVQKTGLCNRIRLLPAVQEFDEDGEPVACNASAACGCVTEPDTATIYYLGGCPDGRNSECYDPDAFCHFDELYWLTMALMDHKVCHCDTDVYDIAHGQETSTEFEVDADVFGYSSVVANNLTGERKAWGRLRNARRLKQLCPG